MGAKGLVGAALAAWMVVGCGAAETQEPLAPMKTVTAPVVLENGPVLNGINPNGTLLNRTLVSVRYAGVRQPGMGSSLEEVWLEGSTFHGLLSGQELSGQDFEHMQFEGDLDDGSTVTLRIDGVTQGSGADQDIWSYRVSYLDPNNGWSPLCVDTTGTVVDAIPLEGVWNYSQGVAGGGSKSYSNTAFTLACDGYALAKCVRFGYAPWRSVNGVSLEDYHQSCTRLLRADYCGDGVPHTVNGNLVNIYDSEGVQTDTEGWSPEAEWTAGGATCFTGHNRATTPIECSDGRLVSTCGESFSPGTLIISETP